MSNKAMPGLVKIGYSSKDPELRAAELGNTGVPHPYDVDYEALVIDPYKHEQEAHSWLLHKREDKEWFKASVEEAVSVIRSIAGEGIISEDFKRAKKEEVLRLERAEQEAKQIKEDEREKKRKSLIAKENDKKQKELTKSRRENALNSLQEKMADKASDAIKEKLSIGSLVYHEPLTGTEQILCLLTLPFSLIWIIYKHHNENKGDVEWGKEYNKAYKIIETEISEIRKNLEHSKDWEKDFAEQMSSFEIKMRQLIENLS